MAVEPAAADRLIALADPMLRWNGTLDVIARVRPNILPVIVDELLALNRAAKI